MKSSKLQLLTALTLLVFAALPVHGNLIVNGDFENGREGWFWNGDLIVANGVAEVQNGGTLYQETAFPLISGQSYVLEFDAKSSSGGTMTITTSGLAISTITPEGSAFYSPPTSWMMISMSASADYVHYALSGMAIVFSGNFHLFYSGGDGYTLNIDNVTLSAVPEPTTMIAGALSLLPFGLCGIRFLRTRKQSA
jgi:hypothetical protein